MAFSQPIEVWGTFSVKDHCRPQPFVTELMLYDRLVIPVPPKDEPDERRRWIAQNWDPDRLDRVLATLGELAVPFEWNAARREVFRTRQATAQNLDPYYTTSLQGKLEFEMGVPAQHIPAGVERVRPVAAYDSPDRFREDVHLRVPGQREQIDPGRLAGILARSFLTPAGLGDDDFQALSEAVEIARDPEFREKRGHFHAWIEGVIDRGLTETAAVLEMQKRIEEYNDVIVKRKVRTTLKYAFFVTKLGLYAATAAAAAGALPALGALAPTASGAIMVAEFLTSQSGKEPVAAQTTPAAMFYDARKHFGWS